MVSIHVNSTSTELAKRVHLDFPTVSLSDSLWFVLGFLSGASGKESACNTGDAGDMSSIPGLGRFPGEGNGNPL